MFGEPRTVPLYKAPKTLGDSGSSPEWQRAVKSLMFGEPDSTVPLYKAPMA